MSSGPIVVLVLESDNAIEKNRNLMGPTDSTKAEEGTLRHKFGTNLQNNAVHGSDAPETAEFEINYFFNALEFVK
jgi:nucleoside-diphosphate kinase